MAGCGHLQTFRLLRLIRSRNSADGHANYGTQMAVETLTHPLSAISLFVSLNPRSNLSPPRCGCTRFISPTHKEGRGGKEAALASIRPIIPLASCIQSVWVVHKSVIVDNPLVFSFRDILMDKSWIQKSRTSPEYLTGAREFLDFAFARTEFGDKIPCPCIKCCNRYLKSRDDVHGDLLWNGIMKSYIHWISHGEDLDREEYITDESDEGDDMQGMLQDAFGMTNFDGREDNESNERNPIEPNGEAKKFYELLKDAEIELYPGCTKFSKLSFLVRLLHLKCLNGWSNKSFDMLLELLKEAFPMGERLPKNYYESKKALRELGLHYRKIDACPNDCMLFWKEYENANECVICGESRWKSSTCQSNEEAFSSSAKEKNSGGTKSFANHLFEETQRRTDGSIPTLADLFLKTHTRKNGTRVDAKSAEIIDQIVDLTNREGGSLTNISDSVYHQVMGPERHGRVRGYGLGPTPTTVFGAKYTQSRGSYAAVCNQLDEMRQLMEDMKKKHAEDLEICKAQLRGEIQNEMRQMMQSMMSGQHQYTSDGEEDS